ncbi:MAG: alpha/beta hydrolase [Ferruginibacter sp.]|nr:alpha/beta hydrolase [Ferruginibacter sp.]
MAEKTFSYQSSQIFYQTIGSGKPLVLIHGFAEDGDVWKNQIEFLKDHFYLIIPDLPGSGKSQMINDMSIEGMAESVKAILAEEKIETCAMAGHSMGGYITLAFAEKYPEYLSSIALVHSSAFADSEEKKNNRSKSIEFVKKNGAYEFLKAVIFDLFTETWATNNQQAVHRQIEKSKNFADEAVIAYYQAMINRPDRTHVLKTFNKPVLFIIGEHDKAVPFEQSMQQCYLPNISHIHILRNSAHMGMMEEADAVNRAVLQLFHV